MGENVTLLMPETLPAPADEPVLLEAPADESVLLEAPAALHVVPPRDDTFEAFFEDQYTNLLRAMYLITRNRHEAEEVTQDAFVRALERWDRVRTADNRPGYLYRIALNLYRSKLRRVARAARKSVRPVPEPDPFEAADDRDAIGRAMTTLPEGQREAVVLVEWLGMTDDEAGAVLGVSPITVRVRLHRARGNLRPILERGDRE